MTKRFFKLLYSIGIIAIVLSLPVYVLSSIRWDMVILSSYKAKCLSNNQYVVLQGSAVGNPTIWEEDFLNSKNRTAIMEQLNFYCKYYNEIQPHIFSYNEAVAATERYAANIKFNKFESTKDKVYAYPELYKLEVVSNDIRPQEVYNPLINWLVGAIAAFVLLQLARICYVYVVFGKLIWHPFKRIEI